jgi:ribosomal protein L11 methyltransferase
MWAYVYEDETASDRIETLRRLLLESGAVQVSLDRVEEQNWAESWKQFFKPREVGKKFLIVPSWHEDSNGLAADRIRIVLDPGQAFGTGDHPTTRLALAAVEKYVQKGAAMLDIGTGSGILSIAGAKLGAEVCATEVEPAAADAADANFRRNNVSVELLQTEGLPENRTFDRIVSNIFTATLLRLMPIVHARLATNGVWIATGIIEANSHEMQTAAAKWMFETVEREDEDGWVMFAFRKR